MDNGSNFLYMPQVHVTNLGFDHIDNSSTFDAVVSNYVDDLLHFPLLDSSFVGNDFSLMTETVVEPRPIQELDTFLESPEYSWNIDDKIQVSESAREESCYDGAFSGSVMKTKRDRSKTLVSERKRRVRMKEKLYELRSLVPNITKMDKASIIADAVVYVQDLKSRANKLSEEIKMLKSSSNGYQVLEASNRNVIEVVSSRKNSASICSKITKVDVYFLDDSLFHVKVKGGMSNGITSSLYSAIESFSCFHLENSNFSITSKEFELALTFKFGGFADEINASNMKSWFMGALVKQGFEIDRKLLS